MAYLITFRYHSKDWSGTLTDSYYKPYEKSVNSLNLWYYASLMLHWSKIIVYGSALITEGLAFFGYFLETNIVVWELGVFIGIASIQVLYLLMFGYAYDLAIDKCRTETIADACTVVSAMDRDLIIFFGANTFTWIALTQDY